MGSIEETNIAKLIHTKLIQEIFMYLNADDTSKARRISRSWKYALNNNNWKQKCKMSKIEPFKEHDQTKNYKIFIESCSSSWQGLYTYVFKLQKNWIEKPIKCLLKPVDKRNGIHTMVFRYVDNNIFVQTRVRTLEIRESSTQKVIAKIQTGKHIIDKLEVAAEGSLVITVDHGRNELITWDVKSEKLLWKRKFTHTYYFSASDNLIVLESDRMVNIMDIYSGKKYFSINSNFMIYKVFFCDKKIVIFTYEENLRYLDVWDISDNDPVKRFSFIINELLNLTDENVIEQQLVMEGPYIIFLYYKFNRRNKNFAVLDMNDCKVINTFRPIKGEVEEEEDKYDFHFKFLAVKNSKMILFSERELNVKIVNYITGESLFDVAIQNPIINITSNNSFLFLATKNAIHMFDFHNGTFVRRFATSMIFGTLMDCQVDFLTATETKLVIQWTTWNNEQLQSWLDFDVSV